MTACLGVAPQSHVGAVRRALRVAQRHVKRGLGKGKGGVLLDRGKVMNGGTVGGEHLADGRVLVKVGGGEQRRQQAVQTNQLASPWPRASHPPSRT